jgi:hypothetical protein
MALTPSAKKKLGLLGLALGALAIDRGLIFAGGSDANAEVAAETTSVPGATSPATQSAAVPEIQIAGVLETLREQVERRAPERNAFRLPEELRVPGEQPAPIADLVTGEVAPIPAATPKAPLPDFEVTSIIAASTGNPMAVVNGTPIRVGQTRNGITLVSVSTRSVTVRFSGQLVEVSLSAAR